ncbi:HD-GYP domain-containing protein [Shewanella donghaensis]|uniref:HD-GYP domain-containing protein n=1 Tax=Shewanella donghaensis TaxID=238836 RepID=UPI0011833224|nr:HD domain-containing phosphohydrolase [Shewanella donghaensis]
MSPILGSLADLIEINDSLSVWRKVIFDKLFGTLAIICIPVYFTSVYLCLEANLWPMAIFDTLVYAVLLTILFKQSISDSQRFFIGCGLAYSIGVGFLLAIGPSGAGFFWLFIFPPLAAILLGRIASYWAQAINVFSLLVIGICFQFQLLIWPNIEGYNTVIWSVVAINFIAANLMVSLSICYLLEKLSNSLQSTLTSRRATVIGLAKLAEYRDNETGAHLLRMQQYTALLASQRALEQDAPQELTDSFIEDITLSSVLHDIGKVGIADAILLKPGRLTAEEFESIKAHPVIGADVLSSLIEYAPQCNFIKMGRDIAGGHHEKWDGSGYPKGLQGENIPLSARIVALVDVYDALTSPRCYKKPFSHKDAVKLIREGKAKHFDPYLVESFMTIHQQFEYLSLSSLDETK